jgi:hypothetical protein
VTLSHIFTTMWSMIECLPADMMGQKVWLMLCLKDLARLDIAVGGDKARQILHAQYQFTTLNASTYRVGDSDGFEVLKWCLSRGLRITSYNVRERFHAFLHLFSSNPKAVALSLQLSCHTQRNLDEVAETLPQVNIPAFKLSLIPRDRLKFQNVNVFDGLVTTLYWNAVNVSADDLRALISGNTQISAVYITNASVAELQLLSMLATSLDNMCLEKVNFTDEQFATLRQEWTSLRVFDVTGNVHNMCTFDAGLAAVARGLCELMYVSIRNISVTDTAVVALSRHCPRLTSVLLPDAFLTTEAVEAIVLAGAHWKMLDIGWEVGSTRAAAVALSSVTRLTVTSVQPGYAASLEETLGCMSALTKFSVGHWRELEHPFPAHVLMGLVRSRAALTSLTVRCPLYGASERVLTAVLRGCTALNQLSCEQSGFEFTDPIVLLLAAAA